MKDQALTVLPQMMLLLDPITTDTKRMSTFRNLILSKNLKSLRVSELWNKTRIVFSANRYTNSKANTLTNPLEKWIYQLSQILIKIQGLRLWTKNKCMIKFLKIQKYWLAARGQISRMSNSLTRVWFKKAILMWVDLILRGTGKMGSTMKSCRSLMLRERSISFTRGLRVCSRDTCTQLTLTLKRQKYQLTSSSLSTSRT